MSEQALRSNRFLLSLRVMPNNIWKIKDHWIFLECSDRVTALIRIITDDALHIPVNIATLQQFVHSLKTSHAGSILQIEPECFPDICRFKSSVN
jgi:hypothetical protein